MALLNVLALAGTAQALTEVKCSELQAKLEAAKAGDLLRLEAGTCKTNVTVTNPEPFTLEGSAPGSSLEPLEASKPIVKGTKPVSGALSFTLTNLTFTNATTVSAVLIQDPNEAVTISNDAFVSNHAASDGAAVQINPSEASSASKPTILAHDTFGRVGAGNSATAAGAVFYDSSAPLVVEDDTFVANAASPTGAGGGLVVLNFLGGGAPIVLSGNTFGGRESGEGNTAGAGAGAFLELSHAQTLAVTGNRFIDNAIAGSSTATLPRVGAGLELQLRGAGGDSGYQVVQSGNVFAGNVIEESDKSGPEPAGGGGEWVLGLTVHSIGDRFEGNRIPVSDGEPSYPPEGGGLGIRGEKAEGSIPAQPATFVGVNDLFRANLVAAGGWGGAIYSGFGPGYCLEKCPGSNVTLQDSTVLANEVQAGGQGGALWGSSTDTLATENSIVYGNSAPQISGFGGASSFAFSDVCNEAGGTAVSGGGLICASPLLNERAEETPASPTLGAGSSALVPPGVTTDLAGDPRLTLPGCGGPPAVDMGAFELLRASATVCPAAPGPGPSPAGGGGVSVGPIHATSAGVELSLVCAGTETCEGEGAMYTTERTHGQKIAALSRRRSAKRKRSRSLTVLVGGQRYKLAVGQTLTLEIPLNGTGKRLLTRFHRLPVHVLITRYAPNGKVTVFSTRMTITQPHQRKQRKKHKHSSK